MGTNCCGSAQPSTLPDRNKSNIKQSDKPRINKRKEERKQTKLKQKNALGLNAEGLSNHYTETIRNTMKSTMVDDDNR